MWHPHIPHLELPESDFPSLMLIGFQNFPFHGKPVWNFILQGAAVFLCSALAGLVLGYTLLH